jgi:hypothetical protein
LHVVLNVGPFLRCITFGEGAQLAGCHAHGACA